MKNFFFRLLVVLLISFWGVGASFGSQVKADGGSIILIDIPKQVEETAFFIPDEYISMQGELILPLVINLFKEDETIAFYNLTSTSSQFSSGNLNFPSGEYIITLEIGDFGVKQKIVL